MCNKEEQRNLRLTSPLPPSLQAALQGPCGLFCVGPKQARRQLGPGRYRIGPRSHLWAELCPPSKPAQLMPLPGTRCFWCLSQPTAPSFCPKSGMAPVHTQPWGLGSQVGSPHITVTPGLTQTLGL